MENGREQCVYDVPNYGKPIQVVVKYEKYEASTALAVSLYARAKDLLEVEDEIWTEDDSDDFDELFAVITVNLPDSGFLPWGTQYIDVNNHSWAYDWLLENNLAEPTEFIGRSGFCSYPAMKFTIRNRNSDICRSS